MHPISSEDTVTHEQTEEAIVGSSPTDRVSPIENNLAAVPEPAQEPCDNLLPITLVPGRARISQYPALTATLAVLVIALLQVSTNARGFYHESSLYFFGSAWLFYYLMGKLSFLLSKLPPSLQKKLIASKSLQALSISLSQEGLEWHSSTKPNGKNIVPWSRVQMVGVRKTASGFPRNTAETLLIINCDDMPDYAVNLSRLPSQEFERLFRWLSRKVPQTRLSPQALYLQMQCLFGNHSASIDSFTQIWFEDFDGKFELANHVCLAPGQLCGDNRYKVEMVVSTRINSSVYLTTDRNGKPFVLKELVVPVGTDHSIGEKMLEQFSREASLLSKINHRAIVQVLDHFVENGRSYVVLECVQGTNLRQFVKLHGRLSEALVVDLAQQMVHVLDYLHCQNPPIIHRDLTPDNIVYSEADKSIVVVDFGAANIYATEGTGTLIGKQGYMPPEQFKGKATPASDVYAFGSTLIFLLTGADPQGMGRLPSELCDNSDLSQLIQACLDLDAKVRPTPQKLMESLAQLASARKEI